MPEGDTVHKLAARLRPALEGRCVEGVWLRDRGWLPLAGATVHEVVPLGKHLLMGLGTPGASRSAWVLHVHLGLHGRWHRFRREEPGAGAPAAARLRLVCGEDEYVCSRAACAEILRRVDLAGHPVLARLGPDLLAPEVDLDRVVRRARRRAARSAADLLLDQGVACGLGNVYKSEVLFLEGVHPATPVERLSDATLAALYRCGRSLLRQNLGGWRRTTLRAVAPGERLPRPAHARFWVYLRTGRACRRCATPVAGGRVGEGARATYWCPRCQPRSPRRSARVAFTSGPRGGV